MRFFHVASLAATAVITISGCAPVEKSKTDVQSSSVQNSMAETNSYGKPVVYQVFTRLFGNKNATNKPWGTIEENGVGKFSDFTPEALEGIRELGVTHIWYTGVPHHAVINDYTEFGISLDDPDVVKGRAGSPYAVKDYYSVNPDLADDPAKRLEEFEALIARTHAHGMKVIIDIVPNHVARNYQSISAPEGVEDFGQRDDTSVEYARDNNFYYVVNTPFEVPDVQKGYEPLGGEVHPLSDGKFDEMPAKWTGNGSRAAKPNANDWYETVKVNYGIRPDGSKDFPTLPDGYAQKNAQAHYAFWQDQVAANKVPDSWFKFRDIALYWTYKGVDGFRFDMSEMVPVEFWSFLNSSIKQVNPNAFLLAEIYNPDAYRDYLFLGKMDYLYDKVDFYDAIKPVMQGKAGTTELVRIQQKFADIEQYLLHFLDNHDEQRLASPEFAGDMNMGKPALVTSALINSAPMMIYFGQEVGEDGSEETGFGDPSRTTIFDYAGVPAHQRWMNGGKFDGGKLTQEERALRKFYKKVLNIASTSPAMTGPYQDLHIWNLSQTNGYDDQQMSFARWTEQTNVTSLEKGVKSPQKLVVVSNFSYDDTEYQLQLSPRLISTWQLDSGRYQFKDLLTGEFVELTVNKNSASIPVKLAGLQSRILTLKGKVNPNTVKPKTVKEGDSHESTVSNASSTSSLKGRVEIVEPGLSLPNLERQRTIRVYLPPSYSISSDKSYPVIYMHDGQNLFDDATSFMGEWQVDESMDQIAKETGFEAIVVGIDNGEGDRISEYTVWEHAKYGVGKGRLYLQDIVESVKPYIDNTYRTKVGSDSTSIIGSSLGGLISHVAIQEYPEVFGKAGILSPSYWYSPLVYSELVEKPIKPNHDLYLSAGTDESETMVSDLEKMLTLLKKHGHSEHHLKVSIVQDAKHNEAFWRSEFPKVVRWLYGIEI